MSGQPRASTLGARIQQDLRPRAGERSQGQLLRALNEAQRPDDWLVVASGTPHVDVHKLWDPGGAGRCLMEVGFSCMGGEIPAGLGVRMAHPDAGEVHVVIGDGTYLMGHTGELVTARQEDLKLTVIVVENEGYQSIHGLQRAAPGEASDWSSVSAQERGSPGVRRGRLRGKRAQPRMCRLRRAVGRPIPRRAGFRPRLRRGRS